MSVDTKTASADDLSMPLCAGLSYHKDAIDSKTEQALRSFLYGPMMKPRKWQNGPGSGSKGPVRRVQQYGYSYDYATKRITAAEPIPPELQQLIKDLQEKKLLQAEVNQIIVNEYLPGQGITAHTDDVRWFGEKISSLRLFGGCKMVIADPRSADTLAKGLYLDPRSILEFAGKARWERTHAIPAVKVDLVKQLDGSVTKIPRKTSVSITFRQVVPSAIPKPPEPSKTPEK